MINRHGLVAVERPIAHLFLYSFLLLFLELALIRWLGSNILFLSYFSNFILLGSFFGISIGFLQPARSALYQLAPLILALLVVAVTLFPVHITYEGSGVESLLVIGQYKKTGFPVWATLPIIFISVAIVMASIAHGMARNFKLFKPLVAYRIDILGSIAGIASFSCLAFLNASPFYWGLIVCLLLGVLLVIHRDDNSFNRSTQFLCLFIILIFLAFESFAMQHVWSPYYKISLLQLKDNQGGKMLDVWVNGTPHQRIESVSQRKLSEPFYFFPYQYKKTPKDVLIIGAGTGGDVAIALAEGATHVDAVEIDPVLYALGKKLNPNRPYDNPKVNVIIDDGRAFLQRTNKLYDMIIFALTDSITLVSGQSSLRLESYMYTEEALQTAKRHLKDHGIFSMYGYYSYDGQLWMPDRYAKTIISAFDEKPCIDQFGSGKSLALALTVSANHTNLHCRTTWSPMSGIAISPVTDNHPFLYLKTNTIPPLYLTAIFVILLLSLAFFKFHSLSFNAFNSNLDLFFMGMAFLLLETMSVIKFSLLFGNTWFVNALVFSGILVLIYFAIELIRWFPNLSQITIYLLLTSFLMLNWYVPNSFLLSLEMIPRFIVGSIITFSPIFCANLLFSSRFQHSHDSTSALGVNLCGAMIGGLLEYLSLITGYQLLLLIVAILYTSAFSINRLSRIQIPSAIR